MKKFFTSVPGYFYIKNIIAKQQMILKQQKRFNFTCFIETGTFRGDMVETVRKHFQYVYSIELQPDFYRDAQKRFKHSKNIKLMQGDSATQLKELVATLSQPALCFG